MTKGSFALPREGEERPRLLDDAGIPFSEIAFTDREMPLGRLLEIAGIRNAYRLNDRAKSVPSQALDAAMRAVEECVEEIARLRRCGG